MKPKSHTLFHFTKDKETLIQIFETGFWPKLCMEDFRWYGGTPNEFPFPIVCFCDIPLSRIDEHVNFYGSYGLGLSKEWAIKNGLSPVLYVNPKSKISESIIGISWAHMQYKEEEQEQAKKKFVYILAHTKPIEGRIKVSGEIKEKEFYQENEWRYVGITEDFYPHKLNEIYQNETKRNAFNEKIQSQASLKISPNDVKYIFVKNDSDIPDIISFIQSNFKKHSVQDKAILMSRVTSLESIQRDV